ncbi:MAG: M20/M25/M40 family metallo-hydrolase, partial [bacterium]|nr:M20/M25/M40 family metallo-hydrolase [bacterium]
MRMAGWMTTAAFLALPVMAPVMAQAQTAAPPAVVRPDQLKFRDLYKELVEINTTLSVGSCTAAAQAMGARLKAAGYPEADVQVIVADGHPREGSLVAVLHGTDPKSKPMLLLAHIDVVEANRADWTRDPFTLIEENGYFYGRGSSDDKAQAAIWADSLVRLKQAGFKPKRDIKMALTCGEESEAYNGIEDLVKTHRALVDAEFALNEGAGGLLDEQGQEVVLNVQAGEKVYQDFTLTVTNPGGHSSRPVPTNAIYQLSAALGRIGAYAFPARFNDATRAYFTQMQPRVSADKAAAMKALVADIADPEALKAVAADPMWNSMLRTTCVATLVNAGHAPNALPQRATANVNCRILPGTPVDEVKAKLAELAADPAVAVTLAHEAKSVSPPPPLNAMIMGPIQKNAAKQWPGVPIVPFMSTGATDGVHTNAGGIPTYGVTGLFSTSSGEGVHGLNERIRVKSLY